ncbi:MAG: sigma-70 family RNA polymerase sigma factor [Propionibacterium sp.]|nr:sigma-70 family RNA polymerase sigma factor [Propionibacterium sp.]
MFFDPTIVVLLNAEDESRLAAMIEAGLAAEYALATGSLCCDDDPEDLERVRDSGRAAHEEFYLGNLRMVINLARSWSERAGVAAEELFQEGCVGLGWAIQRWDYRRGYRFSSFAWQIVEAAISHAALRRCGMIEASRFRMRNAMQLRRVQERLEMVLGREVGVAELADYLGRDPGVVAETLRLTAPSSLTDDLLAVLPDNGDEPSDDLHAELRECLDELPRSEAFILRCSYGIDEPPVTRAAMAARLGMSVSTLRRVESRALGRLRTLMTEADAA